MKKWEEILNYNIKHSDKVKLLTKPIKDYLNITYFAYLRIDFDGHYVTLLNSRPDWLEFCIQTKLILLDPYLNHPKCYQSGISLWECPNAEEILKHMKSFNSDHGFCLIERSNEYIDFFCFGGVKSISNIKEHYINNSLPFKSFKNYFKNENKSILSQLDKQSSPLSKLIENNTCKPDCNNFPESKKFSYLLSLGFEAEIEKAKKLSKREKQCIKYLVDGKTAKESAALLRLSPRTVEFYLENIKNKLFCVNKQQVYSVGKLLIDLELF